MALWPVAIVAVVDVDVLLAVDSGDGRRLLAPSPPARGKVIMLRTTRCIFT